MKNRRRKSALPRLLFLLLLCALLGRFVFVVRNVEVQGDTLSLSQLDVVRAANLELGGSIFRVDRDRVRSGVNGTGVLQLKDVHIRYPATVCITVEPRSRCAMLLHMGKIRILDAHGVVVESLDQAPDADLIYVSGMRIMGCTAGEVIRTDEKQLAAYRQILQAISQCGAGIYVSEIQLSDLEEISIVTRNGVQVKIGDTENILQKVQLMKGVVADLERRGETGGTLDVRSGNKADYLPRS